MKSAFSTSWNASKQPRKQVKFRANAPQHIRRKFMGAPLAKSLRERYGQRSVVLRKGDEVKVMRGSFKGKQGKITVVDITRTRVQINGLERKKKSGEKLEAWFNPSNVLVIAPDTSDNKRLKAVSSKTDKKPAQPKETQTKSSEEKNAHKKK